MSTTHTVGDRLTLAVTTLVFTVFALSLGDALIKRFSTDFTLWQIFVIRSVLALPVVIAGIKIGFAETPLWPRSPGWTLLRSLMLCFMWVAYYIALPQVALSVAAAAFYTLPLFITLFAALFLGDRVGLIGWLAVCLGFCGVLLVLKPHSDDFNVYAMLPIVSAILYALSMIITRSKCRNENALVLSLVLNLSFVGIGLVATVLIFTLSSPLPDPSRYSFLLGSWSAMVGSDWLVMGLLTTAILIGSIGTAIAYQMGPPSILGTIDFAYVGFAAGWGFLFFAEVPDKVTATGMIMIVAAGLLAVKR
ncbi:MAG: DMT family transporter [Gammaproteobacteria bacterium]